MSYIVARVVALYTEDEPSSLALRLRKYAAVSRVLVAESEKGTPSQAVIHIYGENGFFSLMKAFEEKKFGRRRILVDESDLVLYFRHALTSRGRSSHVKRGASCRHVDMTNTLFAKNAGSRELEQSWRD